MLDFERTFSLSRFGKQTADNFVHRATRSKMTGFKTTPLFWGYGQGLIPALLLKSERKHYLPFWEDRFCFSNSGSERT